MSNSKNKDTVKIKALLGNRPSTEPANGKRNWIGIKTLYLRETKRFMKVYIQTIIAPVITTLIFLTIFSLAIGRARGEINGIPFTQFLAPGLIMMAIHMLKHGILIPAVFMYTSTEPRLLPHKLANCKSLSMMKSIEILSRQSLVAKLTIMPSSNRNEFLRVDSEIIISMKP